MGKDGQMSLSPEIRDKILEYIQSGDCPTYMLPVYRWWLQRRDAQVCPEPIPTIWYLLAGRGCLSGDTLVYDPILDNHRPIKDMKKPGWVLTTSGPMMASSSYIKGEAELFTLETETGDAVQATAEHRFLTQRGYVCLRDIEIGDEILSLDPSKLTEDVRHSMQTVEDFRCDCRQQSHSCGPQLPLDQEGGKQNSPLQDDALEHNLRQFDSDDSKLLLEDIRLYLESVLRSKNDFSQVGLSEEDVLPLLRLLSDESFLPRLLETVRFLHMTYSDRNSNLSLDQFSLPERYELYDDLFFSDAGPLPLAGVSQAMFLGCQTGQTTPSGSTLLLDRGETPLRSVDASCDFSGPFLPPINTVQNRFQLHYTTWSRVKSINSSGIQTFYDIHVPGPNNYLAAGMFHHNSGKTWTASNHLYEYCVNLPWTSENDEVYIGLVGASFDDVKHTMVEGKSGILKVIPEDNLIAWNRTVGELKFYIQDGENRRTILANAYTAERPDKLRGPNTHVVWVDEPAKFKDADVDPTKPSTTWNNLILGLRLGPTPHVVVTGTPTRCRLIRYLDNHPKMIQSHMTTLDNADNLPASYLEELLRLPKNSPSYRQEVLGEIIYDNPDSVFKQNVIDDNRWEILPENGEETPFFKVLGYDPSASSSASSDECGIILSGYTPEVKQATGELGGRPIVVKPIHAYVIKDLSGHYTPKEQTQLVIQTVLREKVSDLVFEQNQGVEFVLDSLKQALKDSTLDYKFRPGRKAKKTDYGIVKSWQVAGVDLEGESFRFNIYAVHATQGKTLRAETVSIKYDSGQIHHPLELPSCEVQNCGAHLEAQMTSWDPQTSKKSPDRLDAMAYCMLHIFAGTILTNSKVTIARPPTEIKQSTSRHGAVRGRKAKAGVYSMELSSDNPTDSTDRGLIPYLGDLDGLVPTSVFYGRRAV